MLGRRCSWWWGILLSLTTFTFILIRESGCEIDFDFDFPFNNETLLKTDKHSWSQFDWEQLFSNSDDEKVAHNSSVQNVIKEEVQRFNQELIHFYREESLREKRSYSRFTYDVKLDPSHNYLEARVSSGLVYPFICHGKGLLLQPDGIFQLSGFTPEQHFYTENATHPKLSKVNDLWTMAPGDRVLHVIEWEQKCFILISNMNGSFSTIFTLHGEDLTPVFRQQIRNHGVATSGKFFTVKKHLYLVITNDNAVHSLTVCPVSRWAGTYMDEIHTIQTRGAIAVETFTINSKEYIAIAQSQDSSGNFEVGTQILRMDEKEDLEKVQLLWSNNPVALQYFQVLEEHYLLIGHAKEPSVSYVFGGLDFIPVQTLDNYFGPSLFMDSFLLPLDKGPLLLAAKNSSLLFYTWSTTSGALVLNSNTSAVAIKYPTRIVSAKFIRPASSQPFLVLVQTDNSNRAVLRVLAVTLEKKEIAVSQVKETESQLAKCLGEVRKRLDEDEKQLPALEEEMKIILTVGGDHSFSGNVHVSDAVQINESVTSIDEIDVVPGGFENREPLTTPSVLLENILEESHKLKHDVLDHLPNILMSNKPGLISGDYTFLNQLEIKEIKAPNTNLELEVLNNVTLNDIFEYALKKSSQEPQHITGEWAITKLSGSEVLVPSHIADVAVDNFLLKKCPNRDIDEEAQEISDRVVFKLDVKMPDGFIMPADAVVNGITISDLVLKNSPIKEIKGFKHATNLIGGDGFTFSFINDKNFPEWYDSVLHTHGPPQTSTGTKTLAGSKVNTITNLDPQFVNGHNWEDFYNNVLRNTGDQEIEGDLQFDKVDIEAVDADSIGGVSFSDLLSVNGTQHIASNITATTLTVQKDFNLETGLINGIPLVDASVHKNENATITGPIELESIKILGNVTIEEDTTIGGKDISELAKLKRTQTYFTQRNQPIVFKAPVVVDSMEIQSLNNHSLDSLQNNFWSSTGDNVIQGPLSLIGRKVRILNDFSSTTLNGLNFESDLVRVDEGEPISAELTFFGDVIVLGNIRPANEKLINGQDFSSLAQNIVRGGDDRIITGTKIFKSRVNAEFGAEITSLNGVTIPDDLIFLNSLDNQFIGDEKTFRHKAVIETLITSVDIEVGGRVNGVDVHELDKTTAYRDDAIMIHGNVLINASFSTIELQIVRKINGVNATDLFRNIIYLDQEYSLKFPLAVVRAEVEVQSSSSVKSINGLGLDDYLSRVVVSRDEAPAYIINGTKTFINLQVNGDLQCDTINGISLLDLKTHAFYLNQPQNITGKFTFETLTIEDNLDVDTIGGIKSEDLVFINDPDACNIDADIIFMGDVIVNGPLQIDGLLNGHSSGYLLDGHENGYYDREFSEIEVLGDLTWQSNLEDIQGISHFLENTVTLDTDQDITADVVFLNGFEAEELDAHPWINGIDLEKMQQDALNIGDESWELDGNNTFLQKLIINNANPTVRKLNVHRLHGIDLKTELNKIVWKGSNGTVFGVKYFPNGLEVNDLRVKDLNHKGDYNWLVTASDNRTIDHMEFTDLDITGDMNYNKSKGFDLGQILTNRVTRDGDEVLRGNYTVPSLAVQNDCNVDFINGIKVSDIFFNNGTGKQVIGGKKTFKNGVFVDGNVLSPDINGYNFATLAGDVYHKSQNEVVNRPFVFTKPIVINDSLEIGNDINNHQIKDLKQKISRTIEAIESRALDAPETKPSAEKLTQIAELKEDLPDAPFWLEYLRLKQNWGVMGPQDRVEFTESVTGGVVAMHRSVDLDLNGSGLIKGCQCNTVRMIQIDGSEFIADANNYFPCKNAFVVSSTLNKMYNVIDTSMSYNKSCLAHQESPRLIVTNAVGANEILLNVSSIGYLSDAKAFSAYGIDYLVLAYFFDSAKSTHDSATLVYRVSPKNLTLVQSIQSFGPLRLSLSNLHGDWVLAIANNRDPKTDTCLTNSAIYRWSSSIKNFVLLRDVKTNGAVDVTFIEMEDRGAHRKGEFISFVAFAQSGNSGDGEVLILKYDTETGNYATIQSIRTVWSVTGLDYVCIQENCYLITVVPQEGVHFHEYRYVEGFRTVITLPLLEARDIAVFTWGAHNERILFPIASMKSPILAEGVIAGNSVPEYIEDEEESFSGYADPYDNTPVTLQLHESTDYQYK